MKNLVWLGLFVVLSPAAHSDNSETTFHVRSLGLTGAPNFRDIGGYTTSDGHHVRWNEVYRSGELSNLTASDVHKVAMLNVASVVDLRTDSERQIAPSLWLHSPTDIYLSPKATLAPVMHTILSNASTPEGAREGLMKFYGQMPDSYHEEYAAMFHQIAAGKLPIIVHCTAGKDRTGVAMAVLLTTLGVPRQTAIEDYTLTEQIVPPSSASAPRQTPVGGSAAMASPLEKLSEGSREALSRSDPTYISAALNSIDREYGSVDAYVERELGVSKLEVQMVRAKLLD